MKTLLFAVALICGCYLTYLTIQETTANTATAQLQEHEPVEDQHVSVGQQESVGQQANVESEPVSLAADSSALSAQPSSNPMVTLLAISGNTITFKTQNGQFSNEEPPREKDIPHLVLYHNAQLTAPQERTLSIILSGIEVPPQGITVRLTVESQHGDPDLGGEDNHRIIVWQEERWIDSTEVIQSGATVVFTTEFAETILSGNGQIPTPSDYFRYQLTVTDADNTPLYTFEEDYAFLMESQWVAQLPEVSEEMAGAAPDELVIYYCDMFPFRKRLVNDSTQLRKDQIHQFVQSELVPAMKAAFYSQSQRWDFVWYQAWTSYSPGEDAEKLNVALADGRTWFHSRALLVGHAGISITVNAIHHYGRADYDTLTKKLMSVFQHELFHNHQRNIDQQNGGNGNVNGNENAWQFFSEGTAVLASTVGQADMQLSQNTDARDYVFKIDNFLVEEFNRSYAEMEFHHAALYWRFLYEQCGGMKEGVEDPTAGMRIIKRTLNVLYSKEIIDIDSSSNLNTAVPAVMDKALEGSGCPFKTYEDSLEAFVIAMDTLRSESAN